MGVSAWSLHYLWLRNVFFRMGENSIELTKDRAPKYEK